MLVYDSLGKALSQLEKALGYARKEEAGDRDLFEQFRNSTIQTFEYSFELAYKLLKRTLAEISASEDEIESLSFNDLIRSAARSGFIDAPESWFAFRVARNKTSHGYEEAFAQEAYETAKRFLPAGQALLERLMARVGR
jgi:nucleotidyltransferase substrate binding protein (TIGR01987 family)